MGKKKTNISIYFSNKAVFDRVREIANKRGFTYSQVVERLVVRGIRSYSKQGSLNDDLLADDDRRQEPT